MPRTSALGILLVVWGCGAAPDWPHAPMVLSTSVDGDAAVAVTPELRIRLSAAVDADTVADGAFLARGDPDPRLLATGVPPLAARAQLVAVQVRVDGAQLSLTPRRALAPESRYTLVVGARLGAGGARLGRAVARVFRTGRAIDGAPVLALTAPADGASGVVRNLRAVELQLSKPIDVLDFALVAADGVSVPVRVSGDGQGAVRLELLAQLEPQQRHEVRSGPSARDADGRPPFGDPPGFGSAASARTDPVVLHAVSPATSDRCLSVSVATDVATSAELCVANRCVEDAPAPAHRLALFVDDLPPPLVYRLRAWDETTLPPAVDQAPFDAPSPTTLSMTEVLAAPLGPRPRQQFVELFNLGTAPIELGGLSLHDEAGADVLPAARLAPGGFALVVPKDFAPDGVDAPADPSALLVRIGDGQLGGNGLRIAGERVWIEDAGGRVVTGWGGWPITLAAGESVVRRSADACDLPSSFLPRPSGGSSPGAW